MSKKYLKIFWIIVAIGGLVSLGFVFSMSLKSLAFFDNLKKVSGNYSLEQNSFRVKDLDNRDRVIHFDNDSTTVLHFWATYCSGCLQEFDSIEKYQKNWKKVNLYMVSLEDPEKVKAFLKKKSWNLHFYTADTLDLPFFPKKVNYLPMNVEISKGKFEPGIGPVSWSEAFK